MRPTLLNPLFTAVTSLPGIGPRLEKLYARLLGRGDHARVIDLLFHLPGGAIDRRARPKLRDVELDTVVTVVVTVDRHRPPPPHRPRAPYQIYTSDDTGDLILTFFNARRDYLQKLLPVGERRDGIEMLARQTFGRGHQRGLPAALDHGGRGEQRNHGLAGADVALQQSQHAFGFAEVGDNVSHRVRLRWSERVGQRGAQPFA